MKLELVKAAGSCAICRRPLNQPGHADTEDCGGDCLRCMAECYDPDAVAAMRAIEPDNERWQTE
jgi:hypothetical protein